MRRLIVLTAILLLTLQSISQTAYTGDTSKTCLPNTQLRQGIKLIEEGKLAKKELDLTKSIVLEQQKRIDLKDSTIYLLHQRDTIYKKLIASYDGAVLLLKQQNSLMLNVVDRLEKENRKKDKRNALTKIGYGLLALAGIIWGITK